MMELPRLLHPAPHLAALEGQVVVVTGAGSGLGRCTAQVLGEAGATVVLADVAATRVQGAADDLASQGARTLALVLDVGDADAVARAVAQLLERFGRLDVVVNGAAIDQTVPIVELEPAQWERIVRTNLSGPFLLTREAVRAMLAAPPPPAGHVRGQVVNICSTASKRAWPNAAAYHATKWGLLGLSHAMHAELRPHGIKVSAVVAGGMRTPFLLDRFPDIDPAVLQDPMAVALTVRFLLTQPVDTVVPELTVLPMRETSWP